MLVSRVPSSSKSENIAKHSGDAAGFVCRFCFAICSASGLLLFMAARFAAIDSGAGFVQYRNRQICCFLNRPILDNRRIIKFGEEENLTRNIQVLARNIRVTNRVATWNLGVLVPLPRCS
jgi:hypothetical protein